MYLINFIFKMVGFHSFDIEPVTLRGVRLRRTLKNPKLAKDSKESCQVAARRTLYILSRPPPPLKITFPRYKLLFPISDIDEKLLESSTTAFQILSQSRNSGKK